MSDNTQPRLTLKSLNERLNAFEERLGIGMNITLALKLSGLTEEEVRSTLHIKSDVDLTADTVLTGLIRHAQNTDQTLGVIVRDQNKLAGDVASVTQAHERLTDTVNHLDAAVQEDHDTLTASVLPRLNQLEQLLGDNLDALQSGATGGRKSFIQELHDRRVSDDDIRDALVIIEEGELTLTDQQLFYELYSAHTLLCSRVDEHETRLTQVEQTVETIDNTGRIPLWGWLAAVPTGVIVWFVVFILPYGVGGTVHDDNGKAVGTFTGGWHSGWLGVGLGLVAAGFVLLLSKGSGHRRSTTTSETETTQSSRTGRVRALRHGVAQYRAQRTVQQPANDTEATPAPESVS